MSENDDNPLKGDKRTDETMMISSDNLSDIVSQAKGPEQAAAPTPPASAAPAAPAASPAGNRTMVIAVAVVVLVAAIGLVFVLAG